MNLDPDVVAMLSAAAAANRPPLHALDVASARTAYAATCRAYGLAPRAEVAAQDVQADTPVGVINLRVYRPEGVVSGSAPGLVFFHGGGWVLGSIDTHDSVCRALAVESACIVISAEYRLAPEHRSPAAADDALAAFRWVAEHSKALGIDATRLGVSGDSAGGFLATYVAQVLLATHSQTRPAVQLLFYPVTDLTEESHGYDRVTTGLAFTATTMRWFRDLYLGQSDLTASAQLSPLHGHALAGLPPTFMVIAANDPLCEEGVAYVARLSDAGVRVSVYHMLDQIHGFLTLGGIIGAAEEVLRLSGSFARRALALRPG